MGDLDKQAKERGGAGDETVLERFERGSLFLRCLSSCSSGWGGLGARRLEQVHSASRRRLVLGAMRLEAALIMAGRLSSARIAV